MITENGHLLSWHIQRWRSVWTQTGKLPLNFVEYYLQLSRWGIAGETLNKIVGRLSKTSEAISGIPGSTVDHQGIPYSLTEEFVSVYRMHSLIPGKFYTPLQPTHLLTASRQHRILRHPNRQAQNHPPHSRPHLHKRHHTPKIRRCFLRRHFLLLLHKLPRRNHKQQLRQPHEKSTYPRRPNQRSSHHRYPA
jgi:hypothetical protein